MLPICVYVMMGNKVYTYFTYLLTYLLEPTEGEQDLMRTCRQEENYNNQGESRLLPQLPFLLLQWSGMNECVAEHEYENMMPCKSRKHAYRKTYENLGKHLDFLWMIGV